MGSYMERLDQYFVANDIQDAKRVAVLLSVIRAKACDILKSLIAPNKPSSKSFDQFHTKGYVTHTHTQLHHIERSLDI